MHSHVETPDEMRERVRGDYAAYEDGWTDAERLEPCLPPREYSDYRKKLYARGWYAKHGEMLEAR